MDPIAHMISKENGTLQIPYAEYQKLMAKLEEAKRIAAVKSDVLSTLQHFLNQQPDSEPLPEPIVADPKKGTVNTENVSIEFSSAPPEGHVATQPQEQVPAPTNPDMEIPPVKKAIADHFNSHDESGRLFNVFKQYYTCLNEACGGTVRVTMKDGVCSLWNYNEWEEFAFIDILEGELRFALNPRYTDDLSSLNFCEVSRILASRQNLVSIQLGDLNKTMLNVLAKAFREVGVATS